MRKKFTSTLHNARHILAGKPERESGESSKVKALVIMEESQTVKDSLRAIILGRRSIQWAAVFVGCGLLCSVWSALGGSIAGSAIMFLPGLLFLPAFVIGNIYSIRAISSEFADAKKQGAKSLRLLWIGLVAFILVSFFTAPTIKRVAGTYDGAFHGVFEVLELRQDGTFTQRLSLPSGDRLTSEGKWDVRGQTVSLASYLYFFDDMNLRPLIPPQLNSGVTYIYSSGMLIRDWDSGYYVSKRR